LVTVKPLLDRVDKVKDFLAIPAEKEFVMAVEKGRSVGRPLMSDDALVALEKSLCREIRPRKRGRKPSKHDDPDQVDLV
jgi:putative transposase